MPELVGHIRILNLRSSLQQTNAEGENSTKKGRGDSMGKKSPKEEEEKQVAVNKEKFESRMQSRNTE